MTLEVLTSSALPVQHGFFTRKGGASSGVFEGLNCGPSSSDQAQAVAMNRARVAEAMDADVSALASIYQVHSADVVVLDTPPVTGAKPKADAMVTTTPGVVLGILTADCQPVLFADREAGVVAAAHAGWRGTLDGVLEATVDAMIAQGATRDRISAVIGPSISQTAYEVGPEFLARFEAEDTSSTAYFAPGADDRLQFDLIGYGLARLRASGIGEALWTGHCTYADPSRFFSYRRSVHRGEADYGRLISTIRL